MHGRTGRTSRPGGGSGPEGRRRCQRGGDAGPVFGDAVGKNDIDDKREHRRKSCFSAFPDGHQKDGKGDPDIAVIPVSVMNSRKLVRIGERRESGSGTGLLYQNCSVQIW